MPVSVQSIDKLLKIKYSNDVANGTNTNVGPWHEQIKNNGLTAGGKYYLQPIQLGMNGGVGFSDETTLPIAGTPMLEEFKVDTKNVFGVFGITLKSLKVNDTPEKIVNLLNREMTSLVEAIRWNLSRSLEMDSTGVLTTVKVAANATNVVTVNSTQYLMPGITVSFYNDGVIVDSARIKNVDRATGKLTLTKAVTISDGALVTIYNSYNKELTGLNDIFKKTGKIYNLSRNDYSGLIPYIKAEAGAINDMLILDAINACEDNMPVKIDFIRASNDVVSAYIAHKQMQGLNVASLDIKGGYKTISFNGTIPIVKSKFAPEGTLDVLDSTTFQMYNLGKGEFDDTTGGILRPAADASFTGIYALFTEQYCRCPGGQGRITGITAA